MCEFLLQFCFPGEAQTGWRPVCHKTGQIPSPGREGSQGIV